MATWVSLESNPEVHPSEFHLKYLFVPVMHGINKNKNFQKFLCLDIFKVLSNYIHKLGVSPLWSLTDVFGLDPDQLEWIPKPVKAVILLFPDDVSFLQI